MIQRTYELRFRLTVTAKSEETALAYAEATGEQTQSLWESEDVYLGVDEAYEGCATGRRLRFAAVDSIHAGSVKDRARSKYVPSFDSAPTV